MCDLREISVVVCAGWLPASAIGDRGGGALCPMSGLKRLSSARIVAAGHAFVQNLRRGRDDIVADEPLGDRVRLAFDELVACL
jgi:hypothetical protein